MTPRPRRNALPGARVIAGVLVLPALLGPPPAARSQPPADAPPAAGVALAPLSVPGELEVPDAARRRIEARLAEELGRAGWTVVPPGVAGPAWQRAMGAVGGLYDPVTGERDPARTAAARHAAFADSSLGGVRAWAWPALVVKVVSWSRGKARWDGVSETVAPIGAGNVPVASLILRLEDAAGDTLYAGAAGWGALVKASVWNNKPKPVGQPALFEDRTRQDRALELVGRGLPSPGGPARP